MKDCDRDNADAMAVLNKPYKPVDIEIRNVTRFSYGEMTDGEFVIWAQGKAGWFEIRPAPHYKSIYEDMVEAVRLLYFVTDIYNEPRKRGGGPSPQLIYQEVSQSWSRLCLEAPFVGIVRTRMLTALSMQKTIDFRATMPWLRQKYSTSITYSS